MKEKQFQFDGSIVLCLLERASRAAMTGKLSCKISSPVPTEYIQFLGRCNVHLQFTKFNWFGSVLFNYLKIGVDAVGFLQDGG